MEMYSRVFGGMVLGCIVWKGGCGSVKVPAGYCGEVPPARATGVVFVPVDSLFTSMVLRIFLKPFLET